MSDIVLLDTSIYLNVLNVPGRNQQREEVFRDFELRVQNKDHFLLPMVTIWETGNHISRLSTGALRRQYACQLAQSVSDALQGQAPFSPTYFPNRETFLQWIDAFPNFSKSNKSPKKTTEGISLSDLSIIKEWEQTCARHPMSRVLIWSLDKDLSSYNQGAR